jgi:HNH endonuclease
MPPKTGITKPCANCGVEVYRRPSELKKAKESNPNKAIVFCGGKCYHEHNRGRSRIRKTGNKVRCDGCGQEFHRNRAAAANKRNFCSRECMGILGRPAFPIGTKKLHSENGYTYIKTERGWEREHRVVMRDALGRDLLDDETVHHRNGVRTDNRIENLELWSSSHPQGQRVDELVEWAREIIARYAPVLIQET